MFDLESTAHQVEEVGYAVATQALEADLIERLRRVVQRAAPAYGNRNGPGYTLPNALAYAPGLVELFCHPAVTALATQVVGPPPVFTNHCDVHLDAPSGWHRDSGESAIEGGYFGGLSDEGALVVKLAVYLQDHEDASGLRVRPRSHDESDGDEETVVPVRAGDIVVFDVRLLHCGNTEHASGRLASKLRRLTARRPARLSVFFTVGRDRPSTYTFAANNMRRQLEQNPGSSARMPSEARAELSRYFKLVDGESLLGR